MGTKGRTGLAGAVACGLLAALAPLAGAGSGGVVYCVPNTGIHATCTIGQGKATVQEALDAALGTTSVADTVRIGPGTFTEEDLNYQTMDSANTVNVIGAGQAATTLTRANTTGFESVFNFQASAPSSVSDLRVQIPLNDTAETDWGIFTDQDPAISRVWIMGGIDNLRALEISGDAAVDDVAINMPTNFNVTGIKVNTASPTITDSTIAASVAIEHGGSGTTTTVDRSRLVPISKGISADSGSFVVRNSIIDLGFNDAVGVSPANFNNFYETVSATVEGSTIVGGGGNSIGVRAIADSNSGMGDEVSTVTLRNSVISGPAKPIYIAADQDDDAIVTTEFSNYPAVPPANVDSDLDDDNMDFGTATLTESNHTTFAPGLDGNHHLLATSPLIDIGDPAAPAPGMLDVDGNARSLEGPDADCTARRDIGADEFVQAGSQECIAPDTSILSHPKPKTRKRKASFTFASTEPGSTFLCSVDGAVYAPCASPFATGRLRKGRHRFDVLATDASANRDQTAAIFFWKIVKRRRR